MKKILIIFTLLFMILLVGGCKKEPVATPDVLEEKITVAFNSDGGTSVNEIEITKGEAFTLPTTTRDGYKFLGWYSGEVKYTDEDTSTIIKNTILTAKWEKEEEMLTVIFDSKGGNSVQQMKFKCVNGAATLRNLPIPKRSSYEFVTWEDSFGTSILNEALITCEGELKLYAVWHK